MIDVRRAAERYRTDQSSISTWHSFSSGSHYDPDNVSFGPIVAVDEHHLDPGAGFERHAHTGVELVSWVLKGTLRHEAPDARPRLVRPGQAQYQRAGRGIEHAERNDSSVAPLRFVQLWLVTDVDAPAYDVAAPPLPLSRGRFDVWYSCRERAVPVREFGMLVVTGGRFTVDGQPLGPGDSARVRDAAPVVDGAGELLVLVEP